jgi:DNA-binding MarR family transcriptional regulator
MKLIPNIQSEKDLLKAFEGCLKALPNVKLTKIKESFEKADTDINARIQFKINDKKSVDLLIQVKLAGYPRDLERISQVIKEKLQVTKNKESVPVIISRSVSPGSRKLLQEQGVGYFDAGGSLYIPYSDGVFYIDRAAPQTERSLQNLYEGRSAQVLQVLLAEPEREWHVNELAELAEVSPYTVHQVFTRLEKENLIKRQGKGPDCIRILEKPGELLDSWAENYSLKNYEFRNYYKWSPTMDKLRKEIINTLEENEIDYALTLSSGAEIVAPFATGSERLYFIVQNSGKIDEIVEHAGLETVEDGATVTFLVTSVRTPFLNRRKIDDQWVADDIQLYLDLSKWRARGKEQAEHLRRERLKF